MTTRPDPRWLACALALLGCGASPRARELGPSPRAARDVLEVGVASVDITPPPGLGLFGHGFEGRVATGYRLRLRCQVFAFVTSGQVVVLAPCDLAAPALSLQRAVVREVRRSGVALDASELQLIATHTHAGPAHYFRARNYASSFSSTLPGFDPDVEAFLARGIAAGVSQAINTRRAGTYQWSERVVTGISRNRSLQPFLENPEAIQLQEEFDHARAAAGDPTGATLPGYHRAVDPRLSVLTVFQRVQGDPRRLVRAGVFAVFAMHPTAISSNNALYHGDVFGYATRYAEQLLDHDGALDARGAVVGIANGAEGDVSPDWHVQGPGEAQRIGQRLAQEIVVAVREAPPPPATPGLVHSVYRDLHLASAPTFAHGAALCATPEIGAPAAGGAQDNPTRLRIIPEFVEGARAERDVLGDCHGVRIPILPPGGANVGGTDFPDLAPVSVIRVGARVLGFVPAEATTVTGHRMRQAMRAAIAARGIALTAVSPVIVGLTNEYIQYIATEQEYALQHYEGASTLWGPWSARFFSDHLRCLTEAALVPGSVPACAQPSAYGQREAVNRPSTDDISVPGGRDVLPDEPVLPDHAYQMTDPVTQSFRTEDGRDGVRVRWVGDPPFYVTSRERLRVEVRGDDDTPIDDDSGTNFEVFVVDDLGRPFDAAVWEARWIPLREPNDHLSERNLRFHIVGSQQVRSRVFRLKCPDGGRCD